MRQGIWMSKRGLTREKVGLRGRFVSIGGHTSLSDKQSAGLMVTYASKYSLLLSRARVYSYAMGYISTIFLIVGSSSPNFSKTLDFSPFV
jgi:hypothetical protein